MLARLHVLLPAGWLARYGPTAAPLPCTARPQGSEPPGRALGLTMERDPMPFRSANPMGQSQKKKKKKDPLTQSQRAKEARRGEGG